MEKLSKFVVKNSKIIIVGVVVLTIIFGYFLSKINVNSDIISYLPKKDPAVKLFKKCGKIFGSNYLIMAALETPEGIFNYNSLKIIKDITDKISELDGVVHVNSLTKIIDIREIEGGVEVSDLIQDEIPESPEEIKKLKNYVLSKDMYRGSIVSEDGTATVIMARISEDADKFTVAKQIKDIIDKNKKNMKVYYTGIPIWMVFINNIIINDLIKLIPFVILVISLILFISFKNFKTLTLILLTVIISSIWTLGLMSILGVDMTMVSDIIPVILIAVGSAYGIHFINKYMEVQKKGSIERAELIGKSIKEIGIPIILAGLTTMAGFFSYITADLTLIKEFGIFTGIGVLFALLLSIIFIPAILMNTEIKPQSIENSPEEHISIFHKFMDKLGERVIKSEKEIVIIFLIVAIVAGILTFKLTREVNMEKYFPKDNPIRKAGEYVKRNFGGSIPVQLYIEADNVKSPFVLKQMFLAEKYINSFRTVSKPQSIADLVCELNKIMNGYYGIPETEEQIANLWIFIEGQEILEQMINSDEDKALIQATTSSVDTGVILKQVSLIENFIKNKMNKKYIKVNINENPDKFERVLELKLNQVFEMIDYDLKGENIFNIDLKNVKEKIKEIYLNTKLNIQTSERKKNNIINQMFNIVKNSIPKQKQTPKLLKLIRGDLYELTQNTVYIPEESAKALGISGEEYQLKVKQSGMGPIYKRLDEKLISSQLQSMLFAFIIVFLLVSFQLKSIKGGAISVIPILFTILFNFGLMVILKIPLDNATVMIGGIIIGIGIDYTIHFISKFKKEFEIQSSVEMALKRTLETTGSGIIINALSVGSGFLILIFGTLIPIRNVGILTFVTMIISALSSITLLPAILILTKAKFIGEFDKIMESKIPKRLKNFKRR